MGVRHAFGRGAAILAVVSLTVLLPGCAAPKSARLSEAKGSDVANPSVSAATTATVRSLQPDGPEYERILDALARPIAADLGQPVTFDVVAANQAGDYAAVSAFALTPAGDDIDYAQIPKYSAE